VKAGTAAEKGSTVNDLVQPILVAKGGTHTETVLCAARASLAAYLTPLLSGQQVSSAWEPWVAGAFTKSVRRAPRSHLDKALESAAAAGWNVAGQQIGESAAVATIPMPYEQYPKVFAKAQVAGTDMPPDSSTLTSGTGPRIDVLGSLSTGKGAAQAAHALWLWAMPHLRDDRTALSSWLAQGMPVSLSTATPQTLQKVADSGTVVRDAGLTEVAPGTVTAVVRAVP